MSPLRTKHVSVDVQNNLQQMNRAIVHSSLDIVFHCVISQIPSWWWCKLFIHRLASLPAHTQPSLLPRPIARLAIPLCIVTILAFSCAALVALRPLFWSTKSPSFLKKIYPVWWWCQLFIHRLASLACCPGQLPGPAIPLWIVRILAFSCASLVFILFQNSFFNVSAVCGL